jgi:host factor-I protein
MGENIPVIIYLINGAQLRGSVKGFDTFTILLETPGRPDNLVYKSMVTSVVPMRPIKLYTAEEVTRERSQDEHDDRPENRPEDR